MMTRLTRSRRGRLIGGVCGGLGLYFGIDPVIVRLVFVVLAFIHGIAILLYPVLWLIMPVEAARPPLPPDARFDPETGLPLVQVLDSGEPATERGGTLAPRHRHRNLAVVLLGIGAAVLLSNLGEVLHINLGQIALPILLIGFGVYLLRGDRVR